MRGVTVGFKCQTDGALTFPGGCIYLFSYLAIFWNVENGSKLLLFDTFGYIACLRHNAVHFFDIRTQDVQKWSEHVVFCTV